jgi:hypothetical protein
MYSLQLLIFDSCYQISIATAVYVHEAATAVSTYMMDAEAVYVHEAVDVVTVDVVTVDMIAATVAAA